MFSRLGKVVPFIDSIFRQLNNQNARDEFVISEISKLSEGSNVLDAGSGSQRYKRFCEKLNYRSQDFGKFERDEKKSFGLGIGGSEGYRYGHIDYLGDIWKIEEENDHFDAILCTEVFEHIPYPIETLKELHRLLKRDGILILTFPANSLRHMDPYFFYSGFSDRWIEKFINESGFQLKTLEAVGDYYRWMAAEIARTAHANSIWSKLLLLPTFLYYFLKKETESSKNLLCFGYHIVAIKN